ncbi:MAG: MBL fold metallo-hydrolase [Pseudomonadota bacterium]
MAEAEEFYVRFWGVRGSIACAGHDFERYGGNTSCVEVRCGRRVLVFDAGTGIRALGAALKAEEPVDLDLFLSHSHFDHIVGIPFFSCLFKAENKVRLWAGHLLPERTLKDVLGKMMAAPLFPVPPEIFAAQTSFLDFRAGESFEPRPGIRLVTAPLNHPNHATGYRVEFAGKSICYVTDTEHKPGQPDPHVLGLIRGADIVVYDATYTDEEFPCYVGWGHSTWQEGVRLADAAGAKRLVIFHHDPSHDDDAMDRIAEAAEKARPGTLVAREGLTLGP